MADVSFVAVYCRYGVRREDEFGTLIEAWSALRAGSDCGECSPIHIEEREGCSVRLIEFEA